MATEQKPLCETCPFASSKGIYHMARRALLQDEKACIEKALKANGLQNREKPQSNKTRKVLHDMSQHTGRQGSKAHGLTNTSFKAINNVYMYTNLLHLTTNSSFFTHTVFCHTFGFHYLCNRIKKTNYRHPTQQPKLQNPKPRARPDGMHTCPEGMRNGRETH